MIQKGRKKQKCFSDQKSTFKKVYRLNNRKKTFAKDQLCFSKKYEVKKVNLESFCQVIKT